MKSNGFKVGDVIHNGWAGDYNCYSIVVGRGRIKTSRYITTSCYKQRTLYKGKLLPTMMDIKEDRQTKIGHIDYEGMIVSEMKKLIEATPSRLDGE